jgi:hypothetical protein
MHAPYPLVSLLVKAGMLTYDSYRRWLIKHVQTSDARNSLDMMSFIPPDSALSISVFLVCRRSSLPIG